LQPNVIPNDTSGDANFVLSGTENANDRTITWVCKAGTDTNAVADKYLPANCRA